MRTLSFFTTRGRYSPSACWPTYRRIPVLAIGRDIYCDTRLILRKLEELFPGSNLSAETAEQAGIEKLLQTWTIDGGVWLHAAFLWPDDIPLDNEFIQDRLSFGGI